MITGRRPFKGEHEAAIMYSLMNEMTEPLSRYKASVPDSLQRIIDKTLAKDCNLRYQHIDELLVDLRLVRQETDESNKIMFITKSRRKIFLYVITTVLFLMILAIVIKFNLFPPNKQDFENITTFAQKPEELDWTNSVAVLPFRDFSAKRDQEYFCNGMTDAIIGRLAKISDLKVIATTSVLRYKNTEKDVKEIGRELNVANVLEGTLQKEKNKIRLSAQLINTKTGFHLWADTYDKELTKVFEIQDEISKSISEALKVTLTAKARESSNAALPQNIETYEFQLRGMNLINNYIIHRKEEDFTLALKMFQKAIELEPLHASSYTGISWAYQHHIEITGNQSEAAFVLKYSEMAYEKNPNSPHANTAMGWVYHKRGNNDSAYKYFQKALESNPNSMGINHVAGLFLSNIGLHGQAIRLFHRANELDPFYLYAISARARSCRDYGEFEKARELYSKALQLTGDDVEYLGAYANLLLMMKQYSSADTILIRAEKINPHDSTIVLYRAFYWALKGEAAKAMKLAPSPSDQLYAILGMKDKAIASLQQNIKEGKYRQYLYILNNPFFDNLRSDVRFQYIINQQKAIYEERLKKYNGL
jgi:TolB-like protein